MTEKRSVGSSKTCQVHERSLIEPHLNSFITKYERCDFLGLARSKILSFIKSELAIISLSYLQLAPANDITVCATQFNGTEGNLHKLELRTSCYQTTWELLMLYVALVMHDVEWSRTVTLHDGVPIYKACVWLAQFLLTKSCNIQHGHWSLICYIRAAYNSNTIFGYQSTLKQVFISYILCEPGSSLRRLCWIRYSVVYLIKAFINDGTCF